MQGGQRGQGGRGGAGPPPALHEWRSAPSPASCPCPCPMQVALGRVHWISLASVSGLVPLVTIGPISIGPGPVERSHCHVPRLQVRWGAAPLTALAAYAPLHVCLHSPGVVGP